MHHNKYMVHPPQFQLSANEDGLKMVVYGQDSGDGHDSSDAGSNSTEVPKVELDPISDDPDYKKNCENVPEYSLNYEKKAKYIPGCIVETKKNVKSLVEPFMEFTARRSWRVERVEGKSTCVLQAMNNIGWHGKYKKLTTPGQLEKVDIGFLKWVYAADRQKKDEDDTAQHVIDKEEIDQKRKCLKIFWKGQWGEDIDMNPYIV